MSTEPQNPISLRLPLNSLDLVLLRTHFPHFLEQEGVQNIRAISIGFYKSISRNSKSRVPR